MACRTSAGPSGDGRARPTGSDGVGQTRPQLTAERVWRTVSRASFAVLGLRSSPCRGYHGEREDYARDDAW